MFDGLEVKRPGVAAWRRCCIYAYACAPAMSGNILIEVKLQSGTARDSQSGETYATYSTVSYLPAGIVHDRKDDYKHTIFQNRTVTILSKSPPASDADLTSEKITLRLDPFSVFPSDNIRVEQFCASVFQQYAAGRICSGSDYAEYYFYRAVPKKNNNTLSDVINRMFGLMYNDLS